MKRLTMFDPLTIIAFVMMILGLLTMFLWALGKSLGWIHSPVWVSMIPTFAEVVIFGGVCATCGKVLQRVTHVEEDVKELKVTVKNMDKRLTIVETIIQPILKKVKL